MNSILFIGLKRWEVFERGAGHGGRQEHRQDPRRLRRNPGEKQGTLLLLKLRCGGAIF